MKYLRGLQSHVLLHELVLLTQCLCLQPASHHMSDSDPSDLTVLEDFSMASGENTHSETCLLGKLHTTISATMDDVLCDAQNLSFIYHIGKHT